MLCRQVITKHKLVEPILAVVMPILCTKSDDEEDDSELAEENNSLVTACTRLIDSLAINLPPEKLLAPLVRGCPCTVHCALFPGRQGSRAAARSQSSAIEGSGSPDCFVQHTE